MNRWNQPIYLKDYKSKCLIPATLYRGIAEYNLNDYENCWIPYLKDAEWRIKKGLLPLKEIPQDSEWNWRKKLDNRSNTKNMLLSEEYVIECNNMTQGFMAICINENFIARLNKNQKLVYIKYIQSAPWNRYPVDIYPQLKLVGSIFLMLAISISFDQQLEGCIGLHALPQAEEFYRKIKMTDFGPDMSFENLRYFEFDPLSVKLFCPL